MISAASSSNSRLVQSYERLWDKLRHQWRAWVANIALAIPLVLGSLIMFIPLLWAVSFSFGQPHEFFKLPPPVIPSAFRLDNYHGVFARVDFLRFFLNSVFVTGCVTDCAIDYMQHGRLRVCPACDSPASESSSFFFWLP